MQNQENEEHIRGECAADHETSENLLQLKLSAAQGIYYGLQTQEKNEAEKVESRPNDLPRVR
jgi:hypothetical protein